MNVEICRNLCRELVHCEQIGPYKLESSLGFGVSKKDNLYCIADCLVSRKIDAVLKEGDWVLIKDIPKDADFAGETPEEVSEKYYQEWMEQNFLFAEWDELYDL